MDRLVVFHIAWMDRYDGDGASFDAGGFGWAVDHRYGHEWFNFRPVDGVCYGYAPSAQALHFDKRFGVPKTAATLDGATVVWTAPHPDRVGRAVVGVWRNATVHRHRRTPEGDLARHRTIRPGEVASYRCEAKAADCLLIPPEKRPLFMARGEPRTDGPWPGQQSVFYPRPGTAAHARLAAIVAALAEVGAPAE